MIQAGGTAHRCPHAGAGRLREAVPQRPRPSESTSCSTPCARATTRSPCAPTWSWGAPTRSSIFSWADISRRPSGILRRWPSLCPFSKDSTVCRRCRSHWATTYRDHGPSPRDVRQDHVGVGRSDVAVLRAAFSRHEARASSSRMRCAGGQRAPSIPRSSRSGWRESSLPASTARGRQGTQRRSSLGASGPGAAGGHARAGGRRRRGEGGDATRQCARANLVDGKHLGGSANDPPGCGARRRGPHRGRGTMSLPRGAVHVVQVGKRRFARVRIT